jgi:hypothetical protein
MAVTHLGETRAQVLHRGDNAMYLAMQTGGSRWTLAPTSPPSEHIAEQRHTP